MTTIRYRDPASTIYRWLESTGETLEEAAKNLIEKHKWELGGTVESLRWNRISIVTDDIVSEDDTRGPKTWTAGGKASASNTRRKGKLVCVSTGAVGENLHYPPGEPVQKVLELSVPADAPVGEVVIYQR